MIHSMTAFARYEHIETWGTITWELRSVNHRYLEPSFKMPEFTRGSEHLLRDKLRNSVSRGKIECALRFEKAPVDASKIHFNEELLTLLIASNQQIAARLGHVAPEQASTFLQWPGVLAASEVEQAAMEKALVFAFDHALQQLLEHRKREGEQLHAIIQQRIEAIAGICEQTRKMMPTIMQRQKQKLLDRFAEWQLTIDQNRLEQEMVILAQKIDVDEELDRLNAHLIEVQKTLKVGGPCGRRLDFLMQELNREANTLGSKSIQSDTSQISVDLKVYIEQMREQIQNIE